jgi:pimeloyl-ACP methyl ester carboxylesterase
MGDYGMTSRTKGFAEAHHIAISGQEHGPSVVLGNGYGTDQVFWRAMLPWLEARARVVRFDWPTAPEQFDFSSQRTVDAYAEDLLAVVSAANAAPCLLIGHSMSSLFGMLAAKRDPRMFRHIVMLAPAARYVSEPGFEAGFSPDEAEEFLRKMGDDYLGWVAEFAPIAAAGAPAPGTAAGEFTRSLRAMRPDVAFAMAHTIFTMDLRDRLDGYTTPTTIIQPTHDPAVPVAMGQYLSRAWPHARLAIIEAHGHFPHLTDPDAVIREIEGLF